MTENKETAVVFRKWPGKDGGILALFPEIPIDLQGYHCQSYEHIGQHGGADYALCISRTKPAEPKEYACLKHELEQRGYRLRVANRITPAMIAARQAMAKEWKEAK